MATVAPLYSDGKQPESTSYDGISNPIPNTIGTGTVSTPIPSHHPVAQAHTHVITGVPPPGGCTIRPQKVQKVHPRIQGPGLSETDAMTRRCWSSCQGATHEADWIALSGLACPTNKGLLVCDGDDFGYQVIIAVVVLQSECYAWEDRDAWAVKSFPTITSSSSRGHVRAM